MASTNPARGMRDFLPADVRKREYVIGVIKSVYESYGFEPLETPAVENIDTLMGKYGDEGNQLIFKILKRGEKLDEALATGGNASVNERALSDLALRYDLTVPLARVVANHKNDLPRFFKRYQIQPVWRADRPARGRFREFYQCDVDCIGSESMVVEAEIISAACDILTRLGFQDFTVFINHRELLTAILEIADVPEEQWLKTIAILDRLDKVGPRYVAVELEDSGIPNTSVSKLFKLLMNLDDTDTDLLTRLGVELRDLQKRHADAVDAGNTSAIAKIRADASRVGQSVFDRVGEYFRENERGNRALSELKNILILLSGAESEASMRLLPNLGLARGLSYYTGAIMEINVDGIGSLGGGGRYDGLIGMFGKEQIPACGFSLGLERILVVMEERGMFPPGVAESTPADVMVTLWSDETVAESLKLANELRAQNLRVTVYPQADKPDKQFKYASQIGVPFLCDLTDEDIQSDTVSLKNMKTRERTPVPRDKVVGTILKALRVAEK